MPGRSVAWEDGILLAVRPWTGPLAFLGLSASSCSPPTKNLGEDGLRDTGQRPPAKAMLKTGQTPARLLRRAEAQLPPSWAAAQGQQPSGLG